MEKKVLLTILVEVNYMIKPSLWNILAYKKKKPVFELNIFISKMKNVDSGSEKSDIFWVSQQQLWKLKEIM